MSIINETIWGFDSVLNPILEFFVILLLMFVMYIFYAKYRITALTIVNETISVIIFIGSIQSGTIPYTPYIQLFFIMFQTIIFLKVLINYRNIKNEGKQ